MATSPLRPSVRHVPLLLALGAALAGCPQDVVGLGPGADAGTAASDAGAPPIDAGGGGDAAVGRCGDDQIDPGEVCDGTALGDATCASVGLGQGDLACSGDCRQFDTSGCSACTPMCGMRQCGTEPVCNSSCGTCMMGESCTEDGRCLESCSYGERRCVDATSFAACGPNDALGIDDFGPRVACAGGGTCSEGPLQPCARAECAPVDVMILMDRSSRIAHDSAWNWARERVAERIAMHDSAGRFGLVQFPDAACAPGPVLPLAEDAAASLAQSFSAPGNEASTPIFGALSAATASFADGVDGQAILLLTAGDEACADPEDAVRQAARLFRKGVRVYVVAVTTQANLPFLSRVAEAGGTGQAHLVTDAGALDGRLTEIFEELGACENKFTTLAPGYYHVCRLAPDGQIACWGRQDSQDRRHVPPAGRFVQIAAGTDNACAVGEDLAVRCWGRDHRGQSQAPTGSFVQVSGGDSHFCGLRLDGTLACWGYDDAGQASPPSGTFKQVSLGSFHSCAIRDDDTVTCWGGASRPSGTYRQISGGGFGTCGVHLDGTLECTTGDPPPTGRFLKVAKGPSHACAIAEDGTLSCWGQNHVQQSEPPPGQFVDVGVNNEYSCAVRADETILCWGNGSNGQTTPP